ncbi:hypothetical protein MPSEU_001071500 [Mayamaea pseudoterrestris]|nr:hypothetical protein MPSEU_001071500 [Mayamaea pseudoterrestris]
MKSIVSILLFTLALIVSSADAFGVNKMSSLGSSGGTSFVISQRPTRVATGSSNNSSHQRITRGDMRMGNVAKFGVFSPAVVVAKLVLGQEKLNKIRGKAIALHSEKISQFSEWLGAYHLRTKLIKKAKQNGDVLGFLV